MTKTTASSAKKGFDIAEYDIASASDEGRPMALRSGQGRPLKDADGNPITITLRGVHSQAAIDAERRIAKAMREHSQNGTLEAEDFAEWSFVEMLTALTVAWTFTEMDGEPFPCTPANARKFWGDRRFRHFRAQADNFTRSQANFMKG